MPQIEHPRVFDGPGTVYRQTRWTAGEEIGMAEWLIRVIGLLPRPDLTMAILVLMLFVGWVIINERRTRHLVQLIRALRGPADTGRAVQPRRRRGGKDGGR
ncbi:hypothetical protein [Plantactinospora sp. KLBMP9567]|uniref:hypothetical protein n=1 Tax=Plantactinospora sp. KLBMP9567 TaxID=3085900 RepID=UPI0029823B43|nr:hypothetical protein [Plantactinospora sp. KLBMP9567]MDW5329573.1 hypothetical protein [Plantactinospora sp. KLBMP9567]